LTPFISGAADCLAPQWIRFGVSMQQCLIPSKLDVLKSKHKSCSTGWVAFHWSHLPTQNHGYIITQNHCGDRACPVCVKYRIAMVKLRVRPYFECIDAPKHIILTVPNMGLTVSNLRWFRMKLRSFYKRLSRSDYRFFGTSVLEIKPADKNLYHIHVHIVANQSPHHEKLTKMWSDIVGLHCSTRVKYRSNRKSLLNYFARRCAMAGVGMDLNDYLKFVKGSRLFNSFGSFPSYLEVLQTLETEKRKEYLFTLLGTWEKDQNVSVPPDWLNEQFLQQIYLESM